MKQFLLGLLLLFSVGVVHADDPTKESMLLQFVRCGSDVQLVILKTGNITGEYSYNHKDVELLRNDIQTWLQTNGVPRGESNYFARFTLCEKGQTIQHARILIESGCEVQHGRILLVLNERQLESVVSPNTRIDAVREFLNGMGRDVFQVGANLMMRMKLTQEKDCPVGT